MSNLYTGEKAKPLQQVVMLAGLLSASLSFAALSDPAMVEEAVNALVADALSPNLELDGAGATVAQRLAALDQARALYLPALDLSARYTRANGGRTIDFP